MDAQRARRFAGEWYAAWNAHDLDAVLHHFVLDAEDKVSRYYAHYAQ